MIIVLKDHLEKNIPTLSYIDLFLSKNIPLTILCYSCEQSLKQYYSNKNVKFVFTYKPVFFGILNKILNVLNFRKKFMYITSLKKKFRDTIFFASFDSAFVLFDKIFNLKCFIHVRELYEREFYFLYIMKYLASKRIKFILTDSFRLAIYKTKIKFALEPIVFPNISFAHPRKPFDESSFEFNEKKIYDNLIGKQVYLYQGHVGFERNLKTIAIALNKINDSKKILVIMGSLQKNGHKYLNYLTNIYKQTIHIPYISYPQYLKITSLAYVGLLAYNPINLNNLFCSPNKIFEYTGFGIPIIGNSIPCLDSINNKFKLGFTFEDSNETILIENIKEIDKNYKFYSDNAKIFYDSFNFEDLFSKLLFHSQTSD